MSAPGRTVGLLPTVSTVVVCFNEEQNIGDCLESLSWCDDDVRLFKRDRATVGGSDPHEKILVDGKVRDLQHPLHHFSCRNIEDHVQRIDRFTSISSRELRKEGKHWHLADALFRPAFRFFHSYVLKRGFMEGFAGFYVAVTAAIYVFLKYAKLWELELEEKDDIDRKRS